MRHQVEEYKNSYDQFVLEMDELTWEQYLFKPNKNSWSIREIIIHVTDAELVHIHRMKSVLSEDNPLLMAFDQDAWTVRLKTQTLDHQLYLVLLKVLMDSFIPILMGLDDQDFMRVGTHNVEGELTFKELLEHSIEHIQTHTSQIRKIKESLNNLKG